MNGIIIGLFLCGQLYATIGIDYTEGRIVSALVNEESAEFLDFISTLPDPSGNNILTADLPGTCASDKSRINHPTG